MQEHRRRASVYAVLMVLGLLMAFRATPHVRAVDFVLLFGCGALFGVSLMGLIQFLKVGKRQLP